jgi:hypothetical protein
VGSEVVFGPYYKTADFYQALKYKQEAGESCLVDVGILLLEPDQEKELKDCVRLLSNMTFFCMRDNETGASIIKPLSEIPHLVELVKRQPLGELFTEGWMEIVR